MSGHSHWSTIKHKKGVADKKRGNIFSKISRMISIAAREKGGDPETNSELRLAIEKAKEFNVPKDNIKKAIQRGTGELKGALLEKVIYEAYGPGKIAIIIKGITDNKNRTLSEIKQILNQNNGKLADPGSVKWMFEKRGVITIAITDNQTLTKEEIELKVIGAGAEDAFWHKDYLDVYINITNSEKVKKELENQGIKIESASLDWVAKEQLEIEGKDRTVCQKLFEALDENDAVQTIYSNLKE